MHQTTMIFLTSKKLVHWFGDVHQTTMIFVTSKKIIHCRIWWCASNNGDFSDVKETRSLSDLVMCIKQRWFPWRQRNAFFVFSTFLLCSPEGANVINWRVINGSYLWKRFVAGDRRVKRICIVFSFLRNFVTNLLSRQPSVFSDILGYYFRIHFQFTFISIFGSRRYFIIM